MVGAILGAIGTIGGGIANLVTSANQRKQQEALRKQTMAMKPLGLQKEQLQKLEATKFAALAGLPTYELYKNALNNQAAMGMRNIRQTAPTGSAALEATNMLGESQNTALNDLAAKDAMAKLELQKETRGAMAEVGQLKDAQRLRTDKLQMAGMEQVSKLENAATYNQNVGIKNILGAIGKGATGIENFYKSKQTPTVTNNTTTTPATTTPATADQSTTVATPTTVDNGQGANAQTAGLSAAEQQELNDLTAMPLDSMTKEQLKRFEELFAKENQ